MPDAAEHKGRRASQNGSTIYFVDFDHTLLNTNSSQEFLRMGQPFVLVWPILQLVGMVFSVFGVSRETRFIWEDSIKIRILKFLNPWAMSKFRSIAPTIGSEKLNAKVEAELREVPTDQIVIVSFGSKPIIEALLADTRYATCKIVAPSFQDGPASRQSGKIEMLKDHGIEPSSDSVLLTDNLEDDADLAQRVGTVVPITPEPADIRYDQPYLPFYYTAKIKRSPGFLIKQVFLEELPIVLLAFGLSSATLAISTWVSLTLLFMAMILTYEIGYAENDRFGEKYESKPKLSQNYFKLKMPRLTPHAWVYSAALTFAGVLILGPSERDFAFDQLRLQSSESLWLDSTILMCVWLAVLILMRFIFFIFNHAPLIWRVYIYAVLHAIKYLGFIVLFPISAAGLILIYAHVVRTWALYAIRRAGGDVDFLFSQAVRVLFLVFGFGVLALIDLNLILNWQSMLILGFCVLRAGPETLRKS